MADSASQVQTVLIDHQALLTLELRCSEEKQYPQIQLEEDVI